eukprot:g83332.t1
MGHCTCWFVLWLRLLALDGPAGLVEQSVRLYCCCAPTCTPLTLQRSAAHLPTTPARVRVYVGSCAEKGATSSGEGGGGEEEGCGRGSCAENGETSSGGRSPQAQGGGEKATEGQLDS